MRDREAGGTRGREEVGRRSDGWKKAGRKRNRLGGRRTGGPAGRMRDKERGGQDKEQGGRQAE